MHPAENVPVLIGAGQVMERVPDDLERALLPQLEL